MLDNLIFEKLDEEYINWDRLEEIEREKSDRNLEDNI